LCVSHLTNLAAAAACQEHEKSRIHKAVQQLPVI
jgi:hypothetical protein